MSSPGPNQEFVRFDYDARGNPVGETPLGTDGNPPAGATAYRRVNSMSVRGQIMDQTFGNGVEETSDFDYSTGLPTWISATGLKEPSAACPAPAAPLVRQLTYHYDHFLNLASQERDFYKRDANGVLLLSASCAPTSAAATETYQYDELQRLTQTSRTWNNMTADALAAAPTQYAYSDLGNITSKSDYAATYTYPPSGGTGYADPGPHAVTSLSNGMTFAYDPNGNLTSSTGVDARGVTFDNLDRPITITKGSVNTIFRYAPDGARYLQATSKSGTNPYPKTVYYVDKLFEREIWNASTEERVYLGPSTVIHRLNASRDVRYLNLDRLGSVEAVTTATAAEYTVDQHSFDAFGKPRKGDFTTGTDRLHSSDYNVTTEHGFTGHEHLDDLYLIHMNGRIYDYRLGRFLSVDPIISNPANSQSINPYSYIGNNPLSGIDPTGYEASSVANDCASCMFNQAPLGTFGASQVIGVNPGTNDVKVDDSGSGSGKGKSGAEVQGSTENGAIASRAGLPSTTAQQDSAKAALSGVTGGLLVSVTEETFTAHPLVGLVVAIGTGFYLVNTNMDHSPDATPFTDWGGMGLRGDTGQSNVSTPEVTQASGSRESQASQMRSPVGDAKDEEHRSTMALGPYAATGQARGSEARGLKQSENGPFGVDPKGTLFPHRPGARQPALRTAGSSRRGMLRVIPRGCG
jgi:RHS repeat-associated protein